ncbi:MAG: hypothetical protein ACTIM3_07045 [Leuconostoc falkenbergense]|uniref:hypothetical protein n=1 Tax=Leuconostoc falkenbergense TaxID=2766470 RepID=UPI003F982F8F
MLNYSLNRIIQTKQFLTIMFIMSVITIFDAILHVMMLNGFSLAKSMWLNTFMASSLGGMYGHMLTTFLLGLYPIWLLLGAGFSILKDFKTGQSYNVVSRVGIAKYFSSQFIAAGLAGTILFAVPLLLNLIVIWLIRLCPLKTFDGQMMLLIDKSRLPNVDKYHFVWWQLENPALTFMAYLFVFLISTFVTTMFMVAISLVFGNFYQILTLVSLGTILLGSQMFDIGKMLQSFAQLITWQNWLFSWLCLIAAFVVFNSLIFLWRCHGELA